MPGDTKIEWADATWNPTVGCTRVSPGCDNCYAFALHDKRHAAWNAGTFPTAPKQYHRPFGEVQILEERFTQPLRWKRPRRIFVDSMADLFHPKVPIGVLVEVFAVMALAHWHTFQVLTKRPQRMRKVLSDPEFPGIVREVARQIVAQHGLQACLADHADANLFPFVNIWLGTSVENQEAAFRIDWLARTPAAVRFLSVEPMLGPVDLGRWTGYPATPEEQAIMQFAIGDLFPDGLPESSLNAQIGGWQDGNRRNLWVICGGESGPHHRPMDPAWPRALRDHCVGLGIPFFFKQGSGRFSGRDRILDGREWNQFPDGKGGISEESADAHADFAVR